MSQTSDIIRQNYLATLERASEAARAAGRDANEVTVVGVTKYVGADLAKALVKAGCLHLGESRPQVLEQKATELADEQIVWHLIGHLQRNKVAKTLTFANLIHSIDSIRLLESINRIAGERLNEDSKGKTIADSPQVLLEVNVSGDEAKHGFRASDLLEQLPKLAGLQNVSLRGLMCMAGLTSDDSETREQFSRLRELRDQIQSQLPADHQFTELSMGMSGDFELAIAEGATLIRVGSVLFEGVR